MSFIQWDKNTLSVAVDSMDKEHQHLILLMNKLHDLHLNKASRSELGKSLDELKDYTIKHFSDEEAYLDEINYSEKEKHKLIHKDLLGKFSNYVKEFESKGELTDAFFSFLKLWLTSHIQGLDKKYGVEAQKKAS